jgi:FAD/FMN-containing dehydrogenase
VSNFEVVLSNGLVVNANATSHVDLFTALKGGANNFGIVTRLDLDVFVQGPMWGGVILYSNSTDQELLAALNAIKEPGKFDPSAMFTFGFVYDATTRAFAADMAMYSSRPETVPGSALETFAKIQPQIYNSLRLGSPGSFAGESVGPVVAPS